MKRPLLTGLSIPPLPVSIVLAAPSIPKGGPGDPEDFLYPGDRRLRK